MFHTDVIDKIADLVPMLDLEGDWKRHANGLGIPAIGINLDRRPDKWRLLVQRMTSIGFDGLIRAPAVDGKALSDELIEKLLGHPAQDINSAPGDHLRLTRPALGCFLSHLAIWKWMLAKNVDRAIIFEDDATPAPHFDVERLRETLSSPSERGLVLLGRIVMHGLAEKPVHHSLARLYYFNGTFAYLITGDACRHLLRNLLPMHSHIDHQMSRLFVDQRDSFPVWHAEPSFFEPDWSLGSDCFVALSDETAADRELHGLLDATRATLLAEGRALAAR